MATCHNKLQLNNKGWDPALFVDRINLSAFLCKQCNGVCRVAVELSCDHDDDTIASYCHDCLEHILKLSDSTCPIDGLHQNTSFHSSRIARQYIAASIVICPYSTQYQDATDEKHVNKQDTCEWKGTFKELLTTHIHHCPAEPKLIDMNREHMERLETQLGKTTESIHSLQQQLDDVNQKVSQQQRDHAKEIDLMKQKIQQQNETIVAMRQAMDEWIDNTDRKEEEQGNVIKVANGGKKLPRQKVIVVIHPTDKKCKRVKVILKRKNGYSIKALDNALKDRLRTDHKYWLKLESDNTIIKKDTQIVDLLMKIDDPVCYLQPK
eukprot:65211_1